MVWLEIAASSAARERKDGWRDMDPALDPERDWKMEIRQITHTLHGWEECGRTRARHGRTGVCARAHHRLSEVPWVVALVLVKLYEVGVNVLE
jgi:hypothetical protein